MQSGKYWLVSLTLLLTAALAAQTTQPAPATTSAAPAKGPHYIKAETPQQRMTRLGTTEDPGTDPDPKKIYYRFGKRYHIEKSPLKWASFKDAEEGAVRPMAQANFAFELYQLDDENVWYWVPEAEQPSGPSDIEKGAETGYQHYNEWAAKQLLKMQPEFQTLELPQASKVIRFEEASDGLPTSGSWRNTVTVADMNGDGCPDIIAPPQRSPGAELPAIFLGDCKGHWKIWSTVIWPYGIQYGGVAAADFNKDGKMDLVFAVHLTGVRLFLGDGKGHFTDDSNDLARAQFPTRRVAVTDLDGDGWPDILAVTEGPTPNSATSVPLRVIGFLNRKQGKEWQEVDIVGAEHSVGGDYLAVGKFNDDKTPDFAASSVFFQGTELIYHSTAKLKWEPIKSDGDAVPFLSYYYGVAAGHLTSSKYDDLVMSYLRAWPSNVDPSQVPTPPLTKVAGLDLVSFGPGGKVTRTPIVRSAAERANNGVALGDIDGDGHLDIVYAPFDPREIAVLLGDGKGHFTHARTEGIKADPNTNYDIVVADVNNDGKPDVIIMYESAERTRNAFGMQDGSIRVFLNRGAVNDAAAGAPVKTK